MTEMNVKTVSWPLLPAPAARINQIKPLPFALALILAPLLVGLLTFWVLLIPVVAVVVGAPLYLIMGVPCYLWALSYRNWSPAQFAALGLLMNLSAHIIVFALSFGAFGAILDPDTLHGYFALGYVFAPIWSLTFARLYIRFSK